MHKSIRKEREQTTSVMTKLLTEYNNQGVGSINNSIRGEVSGFDMNNMRLPYLFSFLPENEGKAVDKKHYSFEGNGFVHISKDIADSMVKNKKNGDYGLLIVEESNGQLGPNDHKCYCLIEQIIYREVWNNYSH